MCYHMMIIRLEVSPNEKLVFPDEIEDSFLLILDIFNYTYLLQTQVAS